MTSPSRCASLRRVEPELVGLPGKAFSRDATRSRRFVVHAAGWLQSMVIHGRDDDVEDRIHTFKSVLASTRLEDPSNRRGRPNRHQSLHAPRERGLIQSFLSVSRPWTPSCGWRGFWPYRRMSRRIADRQPRLGLATCVRQNTQFTTTKPNNR